MVPKLSLGRPQDTQLKVMVPITSAEKFSLTLMLRTELPYKAPLIKPRAALGKVLYQWT